MATRVLVLATYLSRAHAGAAHATMDICNALADTSWAEVSVFGYSRDEGALAPSIRYVGGRARPEPRFVWRFPSLYAERYAEAALREAALPPADLVYTQNTVLGLAYRRLSEATPVGCVRWSESWASPTVCTSWGTPTPRHTSRRPTSSPCPA